MARDGRVSLDDAAEPAENGTVVARVRDGPSSFVVHLTAIRRELQVSCTCPVFALGRDACRHVWAALIATDRARRLRMPFDFELTSSARRSSAFARPR
jgi:uncharacterized Zn finger protein